MLPRILPLADRATSVVGCSVPAQTRKNRPRSGTVVTTRPPVQTMSTRAVDGLTRPETAENPVGGADEPFRCSVPAACPSTVMSVPDARVQSWDSSPKVQEGPTGSGLTRRQLPSSISPNQNTPTRCAGFPAIQAHLIPFPGARFVGSPPPYTAGTGWVPSTECDRGGGGARQRGLQAQDERSVRPEDDVARDPERPHVSSHQQVEFVWS